MRHIVTSKLPFALLILAAVVIAAATFVESSYGTALAHEWIYNSWAFKILWGAIVVSGGVLLWKKRMWRRWTVFLLHVSFVVILAGALLTNLTSKKGILHLREGIPTDRFLSDNQLEQLPFLIRLDSFAVQYYPGTEAPQDYVSIVTIDDCQHRISMNQIGRTEGYRFYQTSYDEDQKGTVLSVNYDPWGIPVTYMGYGLMALGFLLTLLRKRKVAGILLFFALPAQAGLPTIDKSEASVLARQQVMWNDRPCPVGVMAQDFLLKVYGKRSFHGINPTQVVASWTLAPEAWNDEPIIKVKRGEYAKFNDFIDRTGDVPRLKNVGKDPKVDEKVALILMLQQGTLVRSVPEGVSPLSDTKVGVELFYSRIDWTLIGMIACFLLAIGMGIMGLMGKMGFMGRTGVGLILSFILVGFALRWYISGHIPLSNGYETMLFVAICMLVLSLFQHKKSNIAVALLMTAFILLVAHLGEANPRITPLMPVLHSPWLSAHVSIIMMSYALLALSIVDRRLLPLAVALLAVGIFLGAIWANVSWGTYWSWDPKESWALVTLLIYSLPLHEESLPWFRSTRNYRIYSLLGLAALLMTYFGVNYILGGMHSYA